MALQVSDDLQLLELMLKNTKDAPNVYKPTYYWDVHEKKFVPELKKLGLHNFRRRKNSILSSFGATDLAPSFYISLISRWRIFKSDFMRKLLNRIIRISFYLVNIDIKDMERMSFEFVRMQGEKVGAKSIDKFEASLFGNPEDIIKIGKKTYTMYILYYYLRYVYCCNYINFDNVKVIVELGCGSGKQVEVIKKLHPDICFLLFDIPPQLYVAEQYLKSVFPDSVVSYRDTTSINLIPEERKGKIFIFGNWKFPILEREKVDLFWNAASLQEMEPDVVSNYLGYVNKIADNVFLQEKMVDGVQIAMEKGDIGVLKKTKLEDYKKNLTNFQILDLSPCMYPMGKQLEGYSDTFWKRV